MTTISAKIIADSINGSGNRLTTMELRYPRCIHSEFMTHRVFSRNSASSRAIPVAKLIESIRKDPFIPLVWGKNQKGMQGGEECNEMVINNDRPFKKVWTREEAWLDAMAQVIDWAERFSNAGYHKQIVNRLLEPWMHITVCVSATEWSNFLALRDHEAAEPHMRMLARKVGAELRGSLPNLVEVGDWHLPYITEEERLSVPQGALFLLARISAARCARTSYLLHDGERPTDVDDVALYERLAKDRPMHASPLEHQATPDRPYTGGEAGSRWQTPEEHGNFTGWRQFRKMHDGERQ